MRLIVFTIVYIILIQFYWEYMDVTPSVAGMLIGWISGSLLTLFIKDFLEPSE